MRGVVKVAMAVLEVQVVEGVMAPMGQLLAPRGKQVHLVAMVAMEDVAATEVQYANETHTRKYHH